MLAPGNYFCYPDSYRSGAVAASKVAAPER